MSEPERPRPRPRPVKTRTSALNSAAVRARYGMTDEKIEAHRAASAERRKSTYGDAAAIRAIRDTISTGVKNATDTGLLYWLHSYMYKGKYFITHTIVLFPT